MTCRILLLSIIVFSLLLSCGEEELNYPKYDAVGPQIKSIVPNSAFIGDIITIIGTGFGGTKDTNKVNFTGADGIVYISWYNTEIKVKVPVGARSGKVSITVNGVKSNKVDFWVKTNTVKYDTAKICNQVWMTKNLDVDHYRNGDSIPEVTDFKEWTNLTTGAWCYYENDSSLGKIYGKLYNWYAVNDRRGLAPVGWHIATDKEWTQLTDCLGGEFVAGGKLKATGTKDSGDGLWIRPNNGATNTSGFSAIPGGWRYDYGTFGYIGSNAEWWSSTEINATYAWHRYLSSFHAYILTYNLTSKRNGFSVRCVRDY